MSASTYVVTGMTCNGCAGKVKREISGLPGVESVEVELAGGRVTVNGDVPDAAVIDAVEEVGYEIVRA
ncbi:heavy-metal-associated domain-containing protein [Bailinhaonella thermotolerans]|uniref:Heavy-metal-associated domain-containing protein n=1 Tax=Bailinhaonella thermotolerans TaxID=1070861 RepID=A0A3A4B035_9ACTN|nr:heavy metal-associated domain-containing protein [Bailinhaonella thermotolerans]RJL34199.1 heavy-metal-associated domain-containing protein [Bailinhaonella thermotolerans]